MPTLRQLRCAVRRHVLLAGVAALLAACGGDSTGPDTPGPNPGGTPPAGTPPGGTPPGSTLTVAAIAITPDSLALTIGASGALTATARAANGTAVNATFTWQSDNPAVATVSSTGVVTAAGAGTTTVRARADTVVGTARVSVSPPPAVVPAAPAGLAATALSRGIVTLTWSDNSANETGFEIERRTARDSSFQPLALLGADRTSYADSTVQSSDTLFYRLRAVSTEGASAYDSALAIVPLAPLEVALQEISRIASRGLPDPRLPADGRDLLGELDALVPQLATHPEVDTVIVHRGTSTAQVFLDDGTSVLIMHDRVPTAAEIAADEALAMANASIGSAASAPGRWFGALPASLATTGGGGRTSVVPGTKRAVAVSIGGGSEVLPEIRRVLSNGGYSVSDLGGSVENLKQYKGIGALYLDAHGGQYYARKPDGSFELKYTIVSSTIVSVDERERYRGDIDNGDLTFAIIPVSKRILAQLPVIDIEALRSVEFGITESFIRKHWQLNDAVVVLHSCFSGAGPIFGVEPGLIRSAIKDAGATVVMGFDNYVWPTSSLNINAYFLDRLLGANQRGPEISPDRRPFALDKVRASMAELGLLRHFRSAENSPNTTFDTSRPDAQIIGVPSIERLTVTDDAAQSEGRLRLTGTFSDAPGVVTVGSVASAVESWTGSAITVRTPFGRAGEVIVEAPGGLKSNEVPLTEWRGGITLRVNPNQGSLLAEAQVDVRFRADAHRVRKQVERAPSSDPVSTYISPLSFGRVVGTGEYRSNGNTLTWNGVGEMRILDKATVDAGGFFSTTESTFGGVVTIEPDSKHMQLCFTLTGIIRVRAEEGGEQFEQDVLVALLFPEFTDSQRGMMGCLELPMDDSWETQGGQRSITTGENVRITFEWTPFRPTSPPGLQTKS